VFRVRTFKVVTKVGRNVREDIIHSTTETHSERVDKVRVVKIFEEICAEGKLML
jgi:hypothetical protein